MRPTMIRAIISLVKNGWRPYNHAPSKRAYERLKCPHVTGKKRPFWVVRGDIFCCVTCGKGCTLSRPEGFYLPLPIRYVEKDEPYQLSPDEMVSHKNLLRVDEAAYCLNVSERMIYDWVAEGKLRRLKDSPVRVAAEDVAFLMKDFEE